MKLSILIPTLYSRNVFLQRILGIINLQNAECLKQTEILINCDNGVQTIGEKRNALLRSANGEYLVFIDDDDTISEDYLLRVFEGINYRVDHIGISMMYEPDNGAHKLVKCSKDYVWCEKNNVYYRSAQHVCPIKSSIAKTVKFPSISFGEDKTYADKITPLIETEHLIDTPIYYYKYRSNK